jgi:hypothetical protein
MSLRVADHPEPPAELGRVYKVSHDRSQPSLSGLPRRASPAGNIADSAVIEDTTARFQAARAGTREA